MEDGSPWQCGDRTKVRDRKEKKDNLGIVMSDCDILIVDNRLPHGASSHL